MDTANIFTLISLIFIVVGGASGLYFALSKKIEEVKLEMQQAVDRNYERMDEIRIGAEKTFMRIDVHNTTVIYQEKLHDEKFKGIVDGFNFKIEALTQAVKKLIDKNEK